MGDLRTLERMIIYMRWATFGLILFSLTVAVWCAVSGSLFGTAINFIAAMLNQAGFKRHGKTLREIRALIQIQDKMRERHGLRKD